MGRIFLPVFFFSLVDFFPLLSFLFGFVSLRPLLTNAESLMFVRLHFFRLLFYHNPSFLFGQRLITRFVSPPLFP